MASQIKKYRFYSNEESAIEYSLDLAESALEVTTTGFLLPTMTPAVSALAKCIKDLYKTFPAS
ncbi:MAG TPA: hypothetical protein PLI56_07140, partial [Exilispira sp.]|nr:hypothetical protein [Exilispira sp.]